ncbi:Transcriptional activator HlyU [Xaviernesmea oryzae]|nr:Transcriptional activator HlyU [Xaviernesmea oryzae]
MTIRARPMKEGAQFRLAGVIEKVVDGSLMTRSFIRADLFTSEKDAADAALRKGQQIIKEQGRLLFADAEESRTV